MHVTYGLNPQNVDDDVRFRTTYYFRTFDYCWDANVPLAQLIGTDSEKKVRVWNYRDIIPESDTLYRYRMTGKASAAFSKIRFESGTLRKEQIDPFGTDVRYSSEADGFYVRDRGEVKALAEREELRLAQRRRIDDMLMHYNQLKGTDTVAATAILAKITAAIEAYLSGGGISDAQLNALVATVTALGPQLAAASAELKDEIKKLTIAAASSQTLTNELGQCPVGQRIRKGFQIMGPEGIKTFDQDERLLMAMSSSASPLIETLQEYSSHILNSRVDTTGQLLALAKENGRIETARREISDARRLKPEPNAMLQGAIDSLKAGQ
jgi:hypothetical protein